MLTVSSIQSPRKRCNTRHVYFVETSEYVVVPHAVLKVNDIHAGSVFDDLDDFETTIRQGQYKLAKGRALRMLGRSQRTTAEIKKKLLEDGYHPDTCKEVLDFLIEYALCDDQAYAEDFVQSRLRQGTPPKKIAHALSSKGVPNALIEEALSSALSEEAQQVIFDKACSLIARLDLSDPRQSAKALRRLINKGFSYDTAQSALRRCKGLDD